MYSELQVDGDCTVFFLPQRYVVMWSEKDRNAVPVTHGPPARSPGPECYQSEREARQPSDNNATWK